MGSDRAKIRQYRLQDGRVVEFDADRVAHCLFELTETRGQPDAFLARELTDGLVYLLSTESDEEIPTAGELADLIEKYVRELGRPIFAQCLSQRLISDPTSFAVANRSDSSGASSRFRDLDPLPGPAAMREMFRDAELEQFSLTHVYPRDVVSVHQDGLLLLTGLGRPFELAGGAAANSGVDEVEAEMQAARLVAGQYVAIDGPERSLATVAGTPEQLAARYAEALRQASGRAGIGVILNLNQQALAPPPRAHVGESLFSDHQFEPDTTRVESLGVALAHEFGGQNRDANIQVIWHLCGRDFDPTTVERLQSIVRDSRLVFAFDRARYAGSLGAGLTREKPAALIVVGMHLHRLAQQAPSHALDIFMKKLGSLARLARAAGHARFDFLRKHSRPEVRRGFLLERARMLVVPIGLEAAVRLLSDHPISDDSLGVETAKTIVQGLRQAMDQDPPRNLESCIDSFPWLGDEGMIAGVTPWDDESMPRLQIKSAGQLHSLAGAGVGQIHLGPLSAFAPEELANLLRIAWHQTELHRLQFHFPAMA